MNYLEVRGKPVEVIPDLTGERYVHLGKRYGYSYQQVPADSADRVILVMSIKHCTVCCVESPRYLVSISRQFNPVQTRARQQRSSHQAGAAATGLAAETQRRPGPSGPGLA